MMRLFRGVTSLVFCISTLISMAARAEDVVPRQQDNEVTRLLERLLIHAPHHFRGLTLFPLELRGAEDEADYATLDEAIRQGIVRVWDSGTVRQVLMQNVSQRDWVLAISGEVILGGKQNRMLRDDLLLAPGTGPVAVPTYCVEKGRWVGADDAKFGSGRTLSNYALRQQAMAGAPQAKVWEQVESDQRRFRVDSATGDYDAVASSPAVTRELSAYRSEFYRIWRPRIVGFVVAQGNTIVGADAFCNPRLFARLRDKLVDSYAFDCVDRYERVRPSLRQEDARDFMARIYSARFDRLSTPGSGQGVSFHATGMEGTALLNRSAVLHLHATPGYRIVPPPPPRPPIPIEPWPQER